jgi:hypothetical protein
MTSVPIQLLKHNQGLDLPVAVARVIAFDPHTQLADVSIGGVTHRAAVATHLPGLVLEQPVLVLVDSAQVGELLPLVIAAWPMQGAPITPAWMLDPGSRKLSLEANSVEIKGLNGVVVGCGEAKLSIERDGSVDVRGNSITSAAIETHRIEGGSIELN